jgi:ATP-dependent Clp protease ATP-binding subunit ClpC
MTALSRMDIAPAAIRADIERIIAQGHPIRLGDVGVTPRARKVIELALDEATRLDQQPAGTEHLLLALIREADAIAAFVLIAHGATLERARAAIRAFDERAQARYSEQAGDR